MVKPETNWPPEPCGVCTHLVHGPRSYHPVRRGGPPEPVHHTCWEVHQANSLNAAQPILRREEAGNAIDG